MEFSNNKPAVGKELVGRSSLLKRIEKSLSVQNLLLVGPRRIGKTSLLLTLCQRSTKDFRFLYSSFRENNLNEVARLIDPFCLSDLEFQHAVMQRDFHLIPRLMEVITRENRRSSGQLVFIIDDFDTLNGREDEANYFFHELRRFRHEFEGVRFIVSGISASRIKDEKSPFMSGVLNDLVQIAVGPLEFDDAVTLAARQLRSNDETLANRVAWLSDGFPHLIRTIAIACATDSAFPISGENQTAGLFDRTTEIMQAHEDAFGFRETIETINTLMLKSRDFAYEILDQISVGLFDEKSDKHARATMLYSSTLRTLIESGVIERPESGGMRFASKLMQTWWFNRDGHSLRSNAYWPFPLPTDPNVALKSYTDWSSLKLGESRESAELSEKAFLEFHRVDSEIAMLLGESNMVGSVLSLTLAEKVLESAQSSLKHCLSDDAVFLTLLGRNDDSWANAASSGFPFVGLGGVHEIVRLFENRLVETDAFVFSLKEFPEFESIGIRTLGLGLVNLGVGEDAIAPFALLAFFSGRRPTASQRHASENLLRHACNKLALVTSIGRRKETFAIRSKKNRD